MENSEQLKGVHGGLKQVWHQVWQTLVLVFIVAFCGIAVYTALNLSNFCHGISTEMSVFILCGFAFFTHFMADFIWDSALPQVKSDYWCEWLANFVFFAFVILGLLVFAIFIYESYVFWFAAAFTVRVLPLIFGILLLISFIYKVMHN